MMHNNQNLDRLGRNIQNVVNQAVNSRDYQQLNQTVRQVVETVDAGNRSVQRMLDNAGQQNGKRLYARTIGKMAKVVLQYFGGIHLALLGFVTIIGNSVSENPIPDASPAMVFLEILLMIGVLMTYFAIQNHTMINRFKVYKRILGQKTYASVEDLARSVGKNKEFVQKDLRRMINKGFFPEGHMDREENTLIVSHETFHYYQQCGQ